MTNVGTQQLNLVLLGPPGAGKGTQAVLLKKRFNVIHVSTGDMLREAVKEGSDIGRKIQEYMQRGELVPDEMVTKGVIERLKKTDCSGGVILDGYPRNKSQAEALDKALAKEHRSLSLVLYFKTSEEVAIQRLSGRRVCQKCLKNYHVKNIPPKKEGICDKCGVVLIQREDDNPETVRKRLIVYEKQTKDLVDYYRGKGILREVNGDISAEKLFEDIDTLFRREGLIDDDPDK